MNFAWIDLETTGLDPDNDAILAIGCIVTGKDMVPVAERELVVYQPAEVLSRGAPVAIEMHRSTGLLGRVKASRLTVADAEVEMLHFIAEKAGPLTCMLAGSSVHFDRSFLQRHMPALSRWFHYRHLDVSVLTTLANAWAPELVYRGGKIAHTPLADLHASLAALKHYREALLRPGLGQPSAPPPPESAAGMTRLSAEELVAF